MLDPNVLFVHSSHMSGCVPITDAPVLCAACMQFLAAESDAHLLPPTADVVTYDAGPVLLKIMKGGGGEKGSIFGPQGTKVLERRLFSGFADACNHLLANSTAIAMAQVCVVWSFSSHEVSQCGALWCHVLPSNVQAEGLHALHRRYSRILCLPRTFILVRDCLHRD